MELTGNPRARQLMNFPCEYHRNGQIIGMNITVVPWMSGVLVVPKDL